MKQLLMQMLEWHVIASSHPVAIDIWHEGAHLKNWLDPAIWHALHRAFAHFDSEDAQQVFKETIQLYSELAHQVVRITQLEYPQQVEEGIIALCNRIEKA